MNWFHQLCRNTGLMIHNIGHPDPLEVTPEVTKPPVSPGTPEPPATPNGETSQRQIVNKTVEEKQIDEKTILRRTTIEEIEIKKERRES